MFRFIGLCLGTLVRLLRARRSLLLENLALRQQLAVLKRRRPRPRLDLLDKLFWGAVRRFWSGWHQSLIAATPETVVRWHRGGFRLYRRSQSIRQARGSSSSCEKHFHLDPPRGSISLVNGLWQLLLRTSRENRCGEHDRRSDCLLRNFRSCEGRADPPFLVIKLFLIRIP